MSWYTPNFSAHTRDIHYTFEIDNNKQNNSSGKKKQISDTQPAKKRKLENKSSETKTTTKQKPKPKPTTNVKTKPKKKIVKKTVKSPSSINKDTFI